MCDKNNPRPLTWCAFAIFLASPQYLRPVNGTGTNTIQVRLSAKEAHDPERLALAVERALSPIAFKDWRVERRSLDARKKPVMAVLTISYVDSSGELPERGPWNASVSSLSASAPRVAVIGMGPAGLYAALELLAEGVRPIMIERGAQVRERRRDLVSITREHRVDADSNYCFGEGGAGTYSDGKLYTRSHKRGDIKGALETLVAHGANPDILVDAHPHIGTNKLPGIIERMREAIIQAGAEVHFRTRFVDWSTNASGSISSISCEDTMTGEVKCLDVQAMILATGHSARDVFQLLHRKGVAIESKPFAMGVRVEHPQSFVDRVQYHGEEGAWLPPAAYKLVCQIGQHGVHSFCMCPGGIIAPCATNNGEVVTNGWSPSKRNNPYANAGIVVTVSQDDWEREGFTGPLGALEFQASIERQAWQVAGNTQRAPAQRLVDFVADKLSVDLPPCSYLPGIVPARMDDVFPEFISLALREAFKVFGGKMRGFLHPDAVVVAPESRTSSPIRIPRDPKTLEHPDLKGFFPCGEGAGYAGGILSAALDGQRVAKAVCQKVRKG